MKPGNRVTWLDEEEGQVQALGVIRSVADNGYTAFIRLIDPVKIRGGGYVIRHVVDLTVLLT